MWLQPQLPHQFQHPRPQFWSDWVTKMLMAQICKPLLLWHGLQKALATSCDVLALFDRRLHIMVPFFLFFTILNTVACTSTSNTSIHGGGASTNCPIWNFCSTLALILPLHKLVVVFRPVRPYIFHQPWNYIITFLVRKLDPECHSMYIQWY